MKVLSKILKAYYASIIDRMKKQLFVDGAI